MVCCNEYQCQLYKVQVFVPEDGHKKSLENSCPNNFRHSSSCCLELLFGKRELKLRLFAFLTLSLVVFGESLFYVKFLHCMYECYYSRFWIELEILFFFLFYIEYTIAIV